MMTLQFDMASISFRTSFNKSFNLCWTYTLTEVFENNMLPILHIDLPVLLVVFLALVSRCLLKPGISPEIDITYSATLFFN